MLDLEKSINEKHLSQPLQTNKKQFKFAGTSLTCYNGNFDVIDKNNNFYCTTSINDDDFNVITNPAGAYQLES